MTTPWWRRCALWAFLRLETQRLRTGRSWYEAKKQLLREAIQDYLTNPIYLASSRNCVIPKKLKS